MLNVKDDSSIKLNKELIDFIDKNAKLNEEESINLDLLL
jgi:hypothetical protein